MAPKEAIPKEKVRNVLVPIRKSKRIAAKLTATNSNEIHRRHHVETRECKINNHEQNNENLQYFYLNDDCLLEKKIIFVDQWFIQIEKRLSPRQRIGRSRGE